MLDTNRSTSSHMRSAALTIVAALATIRTILGERVVRMHKADNVVEKYMTAVKKLSADFPNHQIELHLDLSRVDAQTPRRRYNYIHLRKPTPGTDNAKRESTGKKILRSNHANITEATQSTKPSTLSTIDDSMQPVYMKDLKKAIEKLDRKYSKRNVFPSKSKEAPHIPSRDNEMKNILQLLEKGSVADRDVAKLPEENMSWFQIKIPNKSF